MIVVIDTNVLLKALPKTSQYRPIFNAVRNGNCTLLLTTDILLEYVEIIGNKTTPNIASNLGNLLVKLPNVKKIQVYIRWQLIEQDQDDDKFADCAIAGVADYIVTDDRHFNVLASVAFPKVNVISSDDFLDLLVRETEE